MTNRAKNLWLNVSGSLGFVPGLMVVVFAVLGIVLVEVDKALDLDGASWCSQGDGSAARTVLSVIAGSLITVAGLTFSITMVVLQLAASQFSPRILRTFFSDRLTQITIGTYVGTFVYAILVLRAVGSFGDPGFVPRLSVTVASLLGIAAVILLIVFLNHVSRMIQVSHVSANIARDTLARDRGALPRRVRRAGRRRGRRRLLAPWREERAGPCEASRPGYVQRVGIDDLVGEIAGRVDRVADPRPARATSSASSARSPRSGRRRPPRSAARRCAARLDRQRARSRPGRQLRAAPAGRHGAARRCRRGSTTR